MIKLYIQLLFLNNVNSSVKIAAIFLIYNICVGKEEKYLIFAAVSV